MTDAASSAKTCDECGAELARGLLACPGCARLLYRAQLTELAALASAAEKQGDLAAALGAWRDALPLLPAASAQYTTIEQRMSQLSAAIDGRGAAPEGVVVAGGKNGSGGKAAAAAGATALALFKSKALLAALLANSKLLIVGLLKLPTLLSMFLFARWMSGSGVAFGLGLVASIYVHEIGHVAALRRYGIAASAPMFVPGLGALVRLNQYPTDAHEEARTGLAGPLWGLCAVVVAAIIGKLLHSPMAISIASAGASLNLFNLIPIWVLDGSRGLHALDRSQRFVIAAVGILVALALHQWMPGIVGVAALTRAFERAAHPTGDRGMLILFAALLVLLSLFAMLPLTLPGH